MQIQYQSLPLARRRVKKHIPSFTNMQVGPFGKDSLKCWITIPANLNRCLPPLLAVHGVLRDAKGMLKEITSFAANTAQLVIAPLFFEKGWPNYQRVLGKRRADFSLLFLLGMLWRNGIANIHKTGLLGYSGGAQFVHRLALLYPHLIGHLNVSSAGWFTMPDAAAPYPYGITAPVKTLSGYPTFMADNLDNLLQLPIRLFVGEQDKQVDQHTRSGLEIDQQQGRHRLGQAANWVQVLRTAAQERGLQTDISLNQPDSA